MRRLLVLVCSFFSAMMAMAQTLRPIAAGYMLLSGYSTHRVDVFSCINKPAVLAQLKNLSVGVYAERRFFIAELNMYSVIIGLPTSAGSFAFVTNFSGSPEYNEMQVSIAHGQRLGNKLDVGLQFNYHSVGVSGYDKISSIGYEGGIIIHVSEKLQTGFHIANALRKQYANGQTSKVPATFSVGWGYEPSEIFFIGAEIVKEEDQPINVNAGFQYQFLSQLWIRTGISTITSSLYMGVGLMIKKMRIDVTTSYHLRLGVTPGFGMLFNGKNK